MDENTHFGRYCKSGVAAIISENEMMCVTIDEIRTNVDNY